MLQPERPPEARHAVLALLKAIVQGQVTAGVCAGGAETGGGGVVGRPADGPCCAVRGLSPLMRVPGRGVCFPGAPQQDRLSAHPPWLSCKMGVLVPSFSGAFWGVSEAFRVSCQGRACHEGTVVVCSGCPHPPAPARLLSAFPRTAGGLTIPVWKAPFPLGVFLWSSSCLQRPVAS